jgi:hypothetical protein
MSSSVANRMVATGTDRNARGTVIADVGVARVGVTVLVEAVH